MLASAHINQTTSSAMSAGEPAPAPTPPALLHFQIGLLRETAVNLLHQLEPFGQEDPGSTSEKPLSLQDEVRRFEIQLITNALYQTQGHQGRAARLLGVKVTTLNSKIKRYKMFPFLRRWSIAGDGPAVNSEAEG